MAKIDPQVIDFVKALARANAARDIAQLQLGDKAKGKEHADGDLCAVQQRATK
jgi:hypothetical protein